jgi:hypothetical protein
MPVHWNIYNTSVSDKLVKLLLTEIDNRVVYSIFKYAEIWSHTNWKTATKIPEKHSVSTFRIKQSKNICTSISPFITVSIHATLQDSRHKRPFPEFCVILFSCEKTFFLSNVPALLLIRHITETYLLQIIPKCVLTLYCNWKNVGVPFPLLSFKLAVTLKPWTFVALTTGATNKYL